MIQYLIATILSVWFLVWLSKNYSSPTVKGHFEKLLNSQDLAFKKLDFELFGIKQEREELRKEYDRQSEYLEAYKTQVDNKANTAETIEQFNKKIVEAKNIIAELQDTINQKDVELNTTEKVQEDLHKQMQNLVAYMEREF